MRSTKRAKAIAAGGIASILVGAVLLIAPPGAGATHVEPELNPHGDNTSCTNLGYEIEAKFDASGNPGDTGQASSGGLVVNWTFHDDGTISFAVDATSDHLVSAAIVKQGSTGSGGGVNVYEYNPPVANDTGLVDPKGDSQFSHLSFCATTEETTTTTTTSTTTSTSTTTTTQPTTTTSTSTTSTPTTQPAPTTTAVNVGGEVTTPTTAAPTTEAPATTAAVAPTTAAQTQVLGATVTRTLPRTGSGTGHLATAGIALMIFGGILVGGSRRALLGNS